MELFIKEFNELTIDELYDILRVRETVFILEQTCIYMEVDGKDKEAYHIYVKEDNEIKAYLRVLKQGVSFEEASLGRVLTTERGKGYANIILKEGIRIASEKYGADKIKIEAQSYAIGLYEKFGFKVISDEFVMDGIPHVTMLLEF